MYASPPPSQVPLREGIFRGQVAIVTGGGSGIGEVIARDLLALGCRVVIASRTEDKLVAAVERLKAATAAPGNVRHHRCNIRDEDQVNDLVAATVSRWGRLDVVVNNGGGQFPSPASGINKKGFGAVVETNLTGTFLVSRAAYQHYMKDHGGSIVNIVADTYKGFPGMVHTGAARAGVINMTKTLAVEWASSGIRLNAVAPGVIYSETAANNYPDPAFLLAQAHEIPAKRLGTAEEVSAAVALIME